MAIVVEFGKPFVPEPGEYDLQVVDVRAQTSRFGQVLMVDLAVVPSGEVFSVMYGIPRKISLSSKLGSFLAQLGFPVEDWAKAGAKAELDKILVGKRFRALIGTVVKEGKSGPITVAQIAGVKKVYSEGEGPKLEEEVPF